MLDAAILVGLTNDETTRLYSICLDKRLASLHSVIRTLNEPVMELSPRMRRVIRFVVAVAHRFPMELWKRRYGVEFVERLLDETLCTRKIRRVMISPHLVRLALEASTARFDILGAHIWIAPWQQLVAPQQAM